MWVGAILLLAGCGRIGFDLHGRDGAVDAEAIEPGLVAWLRMEDDAGDGDLLDSAGGDHTATCSVGLTCGTSVAGRLGQATQLDGTQYYEIAFDPAFNTPSEFTVAAWVRVDRLSAQQTIATKRYATIHNSWSVHTASMTDDTWIFESAVSPANGHYERIVLAELGVWMHLAVSWDDTTKRGYADGVRLRDMVRPDIAFDDQGLVIGADIDAATTFAFLTGAIDDLRIYNRKLSDFEIQQLAAQ